MPRICHFFGITIAMYYNDHSPPHFHALYGDREALVAIGTLEFLEGTLPRRAMAMVLEWATLYRLELAENWERARRGEPLQQIPPLD